MNYRPVWRVLEATRGVFTLDVIKNKLYDARADLMTINLRLYDGEVGSCAISQSAPAYMVTGTNMSGWTATHSECTGTAYYYPNLEDTDVILGYTELLDAVGSAFNNYAAFKKGTLDFGYGQYDENTYSGTICATTVGGADSCSVGSEIPQYTLGEVTPWVDAMIAHKPDIRMLTFVDNESLYEYATETYNQTGVRADCWGWREAATANCPTTGPWMCGIYPRTFAVTTGSGQTANNPDVDLTAPVTLESCSTVSSWDSSSYDFASSLSWALTNGVSVFNTKNQFDWSSGYDSSMTTTLRTMGYRYYLQDATNSSTVTAGNNLSVTTTWKNRGVAPSYDNYKIMFKLVGRSDGQIYKYKTSDIVNYAAGSTTATVSTVPIPTYVVAQTYDIYVAVGEDWPELRLAVSLNPANRWYQATTVAVTNSSPTAIPTTDYAGQFTFANGEYLDVADNAAVSLNGTSYTLVARAYMTDNSTAHTIVAKGNVTSASTEYSLFYSQTDNRYKFRTTNGTTTYAVLADNYGIPPLNTWACLIASYDNSSKQMRLRVNNGTANTTTATGSVPDNSTALQIGNDTSGRYWAGRLDKIRGYKRLLTTAEETAACTGNGLAVADMDYEQRRGLYFDFELDETSGNRAGTFQPHTATDVNTVTQASAQ